MNSGGKWNIFLQLFSFTVQLYINNFNFREPGNFFPFKTLILTQARHKQPEDSERHFSSLLLELNPLRAAQLTTKVSPKRAVTGWDLNFSAILHL